MTCSNARYVKNMTSTAKPEVHNVSQCCHEDRATVTVNRHKNFGEVWPCGFWDMREERTNWHALIIIHCTRLGGEVMADNTTTLFLLKWCQ